MEPTDLLLKFFISKLLYFQKSLFWMKYKVVNGKLKFSYDLYYEIFIILLIPEYYKVLES